MFFNLDKVVANDASEFATVKENEELRFNTGIKVHLDHGSLITINSNVLELLELSSEGIIIFFDLGDDWVPLCSEVEQGKDWSFLIEEFNGLFKILRYL